MLKRASVSLKLALERNKLFRRTAKENIGTWNVALNRKATHCSRVW